MELGKRQEDHLSTLLLNPKLESSLIQHSSLILKMGSDSQPLPVSALTKVIDFAFSLITR